MHHPGNQDPTSTFFSFYGGTLYEKEFIINDIWIGKVEKSYLSAEILELDKLNQSQSSCMISW